MLKKNACQEKYKDLNEGMPVYNLEGDKLGKIVDLGDDSFAIEKGFFFPDDFTARYDNIVEIRDGQVILDQSRKELEPWKDQKYVGWNEYEARNAVEKASSPIKGTSETNENEIRVPLVEEQLEARKTNRKAGEVKLRKVVHTELRHLTVPVTREEVVVERTPAGEVGREATPSEARFEDKTVTIPVMEEKVEVTKRPIVKEEVHLKKEARTEQQTVSGEVKSEEAKIEGKEKVKKPKAA